MRVDPYPISGRGTVAITDGTLRVEGGRGIPWQVEVGGLVGLVAGVAVSWLLAKPLGYTLTLVAVMAFITAGSALGYRLAGNRIRARHQASFARDSIVDVSADAAEVRITISFRKRWQTRKQCLHFRPDDASQVDAVRSAVDALIGLRAS